MQITRTSAFSGKTSTMDLDVSPEQMDAYHNGALLQVAFPNLSPDEREFFKTGITPQEWDAQFGEEDE
jgi:hypothetical protein